MIARAKGPVRAQAVLSLLKLFLDIVPSSSENITRVMREQPKRLSRITLEKWRERHFMFYFRFVPEMFSVLSAAFVCSQAFRLFFCSFGCTLFRF